MDNEGAIEHNGTLMSDDKKNNEWEWNKRQHKDLRLNWQQLNEWSVGNEDGYSEIDPEWTLLFRSLHRLLALILLSVFRRYPSVDFFMVNLVVSTTFMCIHFGFFCVRTTPSIHYPSPSLFHSLVPSPFAFSLFCSPILSLLLCSLRLSTLELSKNEEKKPSDRKDTQSTDTSSPSKTTKRDIPVNNKQQQDPLSNSNSRIVIDATLPSSLSLFTLCPFCLHFISHSHTFISSVVLCLLLQVHPSLLLLILPMLLLCRPSVLTTFYCDSFCDFDSVSFYPLTLLPPSPLLLIILFLLPFPFPSRPFFFPHSALSSDNHLALCQYSRGFYIYQRRTLLPIYSAPLYSLLSFLSPSALPCFFVISTGSRPFA